MDALIREWLAGASEALHCDVCQHVCQHVCVRRVQARKVNTPGQALLYYGCRKAEEDYLYEQDWQALMEAGALSKLRVAFSRAQASKVSCCDGRELHAPVHGQLWG